MRVCFCTCDVWYPHHVRVHACARACHEIAFLRSLESFVPPPPQNVPPQHFRGSSRSQAELNIAHLLVVSRTIPYRTRCAHREAISRGSPRGLWCHAAAIHVVPRVRIDDTTTCISPRAHNTYPRLAYDDIRHACVYTQDFQRMISVTHVYIQKTFK